MGYINKHFEMLAQFWPVICLENGELSRLTVVSCEAKEKAATKAPMDLQLTHVSILQEH